MWELLAGVYVPATKFKMPKATWVLVYLFLIIFARTRVCVCTGALRGQKRLFDLLENNL